jgi:hypothetical protein
MLFLLSSSIWWYLGHDHTEWSRTPQTKGAQIYWKPLRSPPINHISICTLCHGAFDGMLITTIRNSIVPLKPEVLQYLENRWNPYPQTIYIRVPCVREHVMECSHDHTEWLHRYHPLNRKSVLSLKLSRSPSLNHRYTSVGFRGSENPYTFYWIACYSHKRENVNLRLQLNLQNDYKHTGRDIISLYLTISLINKLTCTESNS